MSTAVADELAQRATELLALWSELAMRHVALGASCGCGVGGVSLRLDDFELDIVGYLEDAGLRCESAEVVAFFQAPQQAQPREQPLRALLADAEQERLPAAVVDWLLPRVERTLRSFAELHGARG
ncbi:MAG TPA: hypothetical protein VLK85_19495 [Ramlibacter sp.]|nr:hypothetical protein [Ramlibacter sp.]